MLINQMVIFHKNKFIFGLSVCFKKFKVDGRQLLNRLPANASFIFTPLPCYRTPFVNGLKVEAHIYYSQSTLQTVYLSV